VFASYMATHPDVSWGIVVNNDIMAPKGVRKLGRGGDLVDTNTHTTDTGHLAQLAKEVWATVEEDPKFCIGVVKMQFEQEIWAAIVLSRHALRAMGYFDEVHKRTACVEASLPSRCACVYAFLFVCESAIRALNDILIVDSPWRRIYGQRFSRIMTPISGKSVWTKPSVLHPATSRHIPSHAIHPGSAVMRVHTEGA
jgi:hypothetical protein